MKLGRLRMAGDIKTALSTLAVLSVQVVPYGESLPQLPSHFVRHQGSHAYSRLGIGLFYHFAAAAQPGEHFAFPKGRSRCTRSHPCSRRRSISASSGASPAPVSAEIPNADS